MPIYCRVQLTQNERHSHLWEIQSSSRLSFSSLDCGREPEQLEETWENSTLRGLGVKKVNKLLNESYTVSSCEGNLLPPRRRLKTSLPSRSLKNPESMKIIKGFFSTYHTQKSILSVCIILVWISIGSDVTNHACSYTP